MPAGAPVKYETPEEMQLIIDKYFNDCMDNRLALLSKDNVELNPDRCTDDEFPTVSGLALSLGMTRKGLIDYENKKNPKFGNTIKRAKARVESILEQRLYHPQPTGVIFNLKNNYGWKDSQELDHRSGDGTMTPKITAIDPIEAAKQYQALMESNGTK